MTKYVLDRNTDYTQILSENGKVNIYGVSLLQSNNEIQVKGLNDSIVAKVNKDAVSSIAYTDYGKTKNLNEGYGYNSEIKDETGLLYLRARYYDPEMARFIQIDNHYVGEKEVVNTQNRHAYTLNNPYKYVDKDGNLSIKAAAGVAGAAGVINSGLKLDWLKLSKKEFDKKIKKLPLILRPIAAIMWIVANAVSKVIPDNVKKDEWVDNGDGKNNTDQNNDNKKQTKKRNSTIKCPEKELSLLDILLNCVNWADAIVDVAKSFKSKVEFNGINTILKYIKEGSIGGIKITISGAREKVKTLAGLSTGPKTKLTTTLNKSLKHQMKAGFTKIALLTFLIDVGADFATSVIEVLFNVITIIKAVAKTLGSVLYNVLRTVGSALLKTVLMPFFGPFAWVITFIIDFGIDAIDWFFDLKKEVQNFVEWLIHNAWSQITSFTEALKKLI